MDISIGSHIKINLRLGSDPEGGMGSSLDFNVGASVKGGVTCISKYVFKKPQNFSVVFSKETYVLWSKLEAHSSESALRFTLAHIFVLTFLKKSSFIWLHWVLVAVVLTFY